MAQPTLGTNSQFFAIFLIPSYLPGVADLSAYALSRGQEAKEWFLNSQVVNRIFRKMGRAQVDLFTSRESAHLPVYFSRDRKDRRAAGINAPVQRWKFKKKYAFPLPQLILLILAKMRETSKTQNKYAWRPWSEWTLHGVLLNTCGSCLGKGTCLWQPWRFINLPLLRLWTLWVRLRWANILWSEDFWWQCSNQDHLVGLWNLFGVLRQF